MVTVTERGNNLSFIHRGDEVQFGVVLATACVCVFVVLCVHVCIKGTIRVFLQIC